MKKKNIWETKSGWHHNTIISSLIFFCVKGLGGGHKFFKNKKNKQTNEEDDITCTIFRRECVCESILYLYLIIPDDQEMCFFFQR
jgi:hypothetical protein